MHSLESLVFQQLWSGVMPCTYCIARVLGRTWQAACYITWPSMIGLTGRKSQPPRGSKCYLPKWETSILKEEFPTDWPTSDCRWSQTLSLLSRPSQSWNARLQNANGFCQCWSRFWQIAWILELTSTKAWCSAAKPSTSWCSTSMAVVLFSLLQSLQQHRSFPQAFSTTTVGWTAGQQKKEGSSFTSPSSSTPCSIWFRTANGWTSGCMPTIEQNPLWDRCLSLATVWALETKPQEFAQNSCRCTWYRPGFGNQPEDDCDP